MEILAHATAAQVRREQKARRVQRTGGERDAAPRPHDDRVVVAFQDVLDADASAVVLPQAPRRRPRDDLDVRRILYGLEE